MDIYFVSGDVFVDSGTLAPLDGVTSITGSLFIHSSGSDLPEIANANSLERIGGDLMIHTNTALASISGFQALTHVGGAISITGNPVLGTIGLSALEQVGGALRVYYNPQLATVAAASLADIGGDMYFQNNPTLTNISGLGALSSIGGSLVLKNSGVVSTAGLGYLSTIAGDMVVSNNPNLEDLALPGLVDVGGALTISGNAALASTAELAVETVGGNVAVTANAALSDISLPGLKQVGGNMAFECNQDGAAVVMDRLSHVEGDLSTTPCYVSWDYSCISACSYTAVGSVSFPVLSVVGGTVEMSKSHVGCSYYTQNAGGACGTSFWTASSLSMPALVECASFTLAAVGQSQFQSIPFLHDATLGNYYYRPSSGSWSSSSTYFYGLDAYQGGA